MCLILILMYLENKPAFVECAIIFSVRAVKELAPGPRTIAQAE